MFDLEDDIPIPPAASSTGRYARYPWHEMTVGKSFFVPQQNKVPLNTLQASLGTASRRWAQRKKLNMKWTTRRVKVKGVDGIRIWRIR